MQSVHKFMRLRFKNCCCYFRWQRQIKIKQINKQTNKRQNRQTDTQSNDSFIHGTRRTSHETISNREQKIIVCRKIDSNHSLLAIPRHIQIVWYTLAPNRNTHMHMHTYLYTPLIIVSLNLTHTHWIAWLFHQLSSYRLLCAHFSRSWISNHIPFTFALNSFS